MEPLRTIYDDKYNFFMWWKKMAKKLSEEEMLEEALKNPKVRRVSGALRDIVPEAVAEYEEKRRRKSSADR